MLSDEFPERGDDEDDPFEVINTGPGPGPHVPANVPPLPDRADISGDEWDEEAETNGHDRVSPHLPSGRDRHDSADHNDSSAH